MSSEAQLLSYTEKRNQLAKLVVARIRSLYAKAEAGDSTSKGQLATLRRSIFAPYAADPQIWDLTHVPGGLMPPIRGERLTHEERVVHAAMCLFARHQQSKSDLMHKEGVSFAGAARQLAFVEGSESEGVRRRMNAAATAVSFDELVRHIAALISMMRGANIKLDYYKLVQDLFDYDSAFGRERVRRAWSRDYVSNNLDKELTDK